MEEREIFHLEQEHLSLAFTNAQWKIKEAHRETGYGIRVWKDGRIGFGYCQQEEELEEATARAKELAKFSPKTRFSFTTDKGAARVKSTDKQLEKMGMEEWRGMLDQLREGAKKAEHLRIYTDIYRIKTSIENPTFQKNYKKTAFSLYVEATIKDGFGYYVYSGIGLPSQAWENIGETAARMAAETRGAKKPGAGRYDVIFSPEALRDILGVLEPSFSGDWKRKGISQWVQQQGKKVADERLSMYDDGAVAGSQIRPWDDEGVRSKKIPLLENGVMKNFLYDRETAALEGIIGEGNCERGEYAATPTVQRSNWVISPGKGIEQDDYLYIQSLHGTHTANTTTGDMGVEINSAWNVKNGKRTAVRGFLITENIFNLLNKIKSLGREINAYSDLLAPDILFGDIMVVV